MKALASSIVRLTNKGADHGYLYLLDFNTETYDIVLKWEDENINWEGRGGDRGLRGIAFYQDLIIVASGKQILFLDKKYEIKNIFSHNLLGDIHELFIQNDVLFITSTLYDLILCMDLNKMKLTAGYHIVPKRERINYRQFLHNKWTAFRRKILYPFFNNQNLYSEFEINEINVNGYSPRCAVIEKSIHINTVFVWKNFLCFTGTQNNIVFGILSNDLIRVATIPFGTHNVTFLDSDRLIMNYTIDETIVITDRKGFKKFNYPVYYDKSIVEGDFEKNHAKAGWGRGFDIKENYFIAGCSPATVNLYHFEQKKPVKSINMDQDIRNSIHGLKFLPF